MPPQLCGPDFSPTPIYEGKSIGIVTAGMQQQFVETAF
jgi:hypothetical protein